MDLHYSQTVDVCSTPELCFNPLWIYTTLKHLCKLLVDFQCFNPLWIYTTLKHDSPAIFFFLCFNPLWIYTTLKLIASDSLSLMASIPYGFTLLSNKASENDPDRKLQSPMDLHYSQTSPLFN